MIVIIPAAKLQSIVHPNLLTYTERWLVCLTNPEGRMVIMGLTRYCLTIARKGGNGRAIGPVPHGLPCSVHPQQAHGRTLVRTDVRPSVRTPSARLRCSCGRDRGKGRDHAPMLVQEAVAVVADNEAV